VLISDARNVRTTGASYEDVDNPNTALLSNKHMAFTVGMPFLLLFVPFF
jgi:hypothetical protein